MARADRSRGRPACRGHRGSPSLSRGRGLGRRSRENRGTNRDRCHLSSSQQQQREAAGGADRERVRNEAESGEEAAEETSRGSSCALTNGQQGGRVDSDSKEVRLKAGMLVAEDRAAG